VLIGPLDAIQRKIRLGYTVPPQNKFRRFSVPFELQAGETEFRIYVRHYGGGTQVDLGSLQLFSGRTDLVNSTPLLGLSDATETINFTVPLTSTNDRVRQFVRGGFSPHGGSQQNIDEEYITWAFTGEIDYLRLRYSAFTDFTNPDDPSKPFYLQAFPETGKLTLEWSQSGTPGSEDIWDNVLELNHATINREWRRDRISWKLEGGPQLDGTEISDTSGQPSVIRLSLDFYGKTYTREFVISGSTSASSVTYNAGQSITPLSVGFSNSPTATPTITPTFTPTISFTPTSTPTPTLTPTVTPTVTP
jgi:hypothetical protein